MDVAIVTGSASGIGLGIARAMYEAGYRVGFLDRDKAGLDRALTGLDPARALGELADVTDAQTIAASIQNITQRWKTPDVLVNNAGAARDRRFTKMTEEDWDFVVSLNLKSQFLCSKAVIDGMVAQNYGRIINISSRAWLGGFGQANYSAAKGGVVSLTRSLAIEFAAQGITVNAIAPGVVDTPLIQAYKPEVRERLAGSIPARRIGKPEDIANAALFFADRRSEYVTGQTLYVCGGRSLANLSV